MDPSRQGLLSTSPEDSPHDRESFDSDGINYLPDLSNSKSDTTFRLSSRRKASAGYASVGAAARSSKKTKCIRALAILFMVVVLVGVALWALINRLYQTTPREGQSPPWYPTPKGGSAKSWAESYRKAADMVLRMTLPEKVNVTTGIGWSMGLAVGNTGPAVHVGFPGLSLQDGPLGIRFADNITAFPAGITVGATFNKELMYQRGKAHALEARGKGINILLGPCVGPLGRMPAGGRNWEGFGSDPYLQGVAGAQTIKGIQDQGVMATIKHFVGNEQEHFRQPGEWILKDALSANIDDRTMHELYAWPFADAVKAGVASVMCSYNMVNNSYACGNSKLLNGILKDEMGFQGFVMSDWLAQRSGVSTALAGLDMTMPGDGLTWQDGDSLWGPKLSQSILNGSLPVDRLNDMVTRIVASWYQLGQDDEKLFDRKGPNFSSWTNDRTGPYSPGSPSPQDSVVLNQYVNVRANHSQLAHRIAAEGTVLLKNDDFLPLSRDGYSIYDESVKTGAPRIGIFGEDAGPGNGPNYCKDRSCNEGTLGSGWGSGAVEFPYLITPAQALQEGFKTDQVLVTEVLSNDHRYYDHPADYEQDICIVFANSDGGEGFVAWGAVAGDRNDLELQKGGKDLVIDVAKNCGHGVGSTIVVIHAVGPVVMEEWIDMPGVKAVLAANLPGQESGYALASIIFGDINPSGKLPYTIGRSLDDYGSGAQILYKPNAIVPQQDFDEGLYVDYRHFDKFSIEPRFEFGYGLSYTSFEYTNIRIVEKKPKSALPAERPTPAVQPPEYDAKIPDLSEALFPASIRRFEKWIYPFIDSAEDIKQGDYPYPHGYHTEQNPSAAGGDEGGNPDLWETYVTVSVKVTNIGKLAGQVVPQLYMSWPETSPVEHPVRVLRGFAKVDLAVSESETVEFEVRRRDLSYWDVEKQNWVMPLGEFVFAVGESSRDLKVTETW